VPLKHLIPRGVRRWLRVTATEAPHRLRDFGPDLVQGHFGAPVLPPARLRHRVAHNSSRRDFDLVGRQLADCLRAAAVDAREGDGAFASALDFGCGCGRVARHVAGSEWVGHLTGVDVDGEATGWCRRHLPGTYFAIERDPPLPVADAAFELVISVSVFTHLPEEAQMAWLAELERVLSPGGLLLASTLSPALVWSRPDLSVEQRGELEGRGFVHAPGGGTFNQDTTFHGTEYLLETWGQFFDHLWHREHGLNGYQDLSLWRRR
jgi:SAM-dependent methyltransferase